MIFIFRFAINFLPWVSGAEATAFVVRDGVKNGRLFGNSNVHSASHRTQHCIDLIAYFMMFDVVGETMAIKKKNEENNAQQFIRIAIPYRRLHTFYLLQTYAQQRYPSYTLSYPYDRMHTDMRFSFATFTWLQPLFSPSLSSPAPSSSLPCAATTFYSPTQHHLILRYDYVRVPFCTLIYQDINQRQNVHLL